MPAAPPAQEELISKEVWEDYSAYRAAFVELPNYPFAIRDDGWRPPSAYESTEERYGFSPCGFPADIIPRVEMGGQPAYAYMAIDLQMLRGSLQFTQIYSPEMDTLFSQFEEAQLEWLQDITLNEYDPAEPNVRMNNPSLERYVLVVRELGDDLAEVANRNAPEGAPEFYYDDACGGGLDIYYDLRLDPARGQLWMISEWGASVCERRGRAIDDRTSCTGWARHGTPSESVAVGNLRYQIDWEDGTTSTGRLRINDESLRSVTIGRNGPRYTYWQ